MKNITKYFRLIRVKQWIKNLLIFLPGFFGGGLLVKNIICKELVGFLVFSLGASVVYIINDIHDIDKDKLHETKKNRPIAAGDISIKCSKVVMLVLFCISIVGCFLCFGVKSTSILFIYIIINLFYSVFGGKNIPLLDVVLLVTGFVLRIIFGGIIINVEISSWLYLVVISGSFFMSFGKRRNELLRNNAVTRAVLTNYNKEFLDKNMYCCMTLAITFYSLWCIDKNNGILTIEYLITIPILLVILIKYSMDIEGNSDGDPTNVILKDKILILLVLLFAVTLLFALYIK